MRKVKKKEEEARKTELINKGRKEGMHIHGVGDDPTGDDLEAVCATW